MELDQIREKIEEIFPKYKHHWFDLFPNSSSNEASERVIITSIVEEIRPKYQKLEIIKGSDKESAKKEILEVIEKLKNYSVQAVRKFMEVPERRWMENSLMHYERDWKFDKVKIEVQIGFWEWYLSEHLVQNKTVKATNEKEEPPTAVFSNVKQDPATSPAGQNPLSVLSQRQLALWIFYRQQAGEMERFENMGFPTKKKAIWSFAESISKEDGTKRSGQGFYDEWRILNKKWPDKYNQESKLKNFEAPTKENKDDHREILKHLEPNSNAYNLAKNISEKIVTP